MVLCTELHYRIILSSKQCVQIKKDMSLYETEAYGDAVVTVHVHKPQYHIQPMDRWKKAAPLMPHAHGVHLALY